LLKKSPGDPTDRPLIVARAHEIEKTIEEKIRMTQLQPQHAPGPQPPTFPSAPDNPPEPEPFLVQQTPPPPPPPQPHPAQSSEQSCSDDSLDELLKLPLEFFFARVQALDTRHDLSTLREDFEKHGIYTPDLIPFMSDADLDTVLGEGRLGVRLFLRKIVGRQ
jgi:hypothetical protein